MLVWLAANLAVAAFMCYLLLFVHNPMQFSSFVSSSKDVYQPKTPQRSERVNLREKFTAHKHRIISQLRQSLLQQKVSSKHFTLNRAKYFGSSSAIKLKDLTPTAILCNLRNCLLNSHFQTLTSSSTVFPQNRQLFKSASWFTRTYGSCAIVSNAAALLQSQLGHFIGMQLINQVVVSTQTFNKIIVY